MRIRSLRIAKRSDFMNKKIVTFVLFLALVLILTGCTQQSIARNWGGTYEVDLQAGQELEVVTWKDDDLWILTKERPADDPAETHRYFVDSTYGFFEGEIIIHER